MDNFHVFKLCKWYPIARYITYASLFSSYWKQLMLFSNDGMNYEGRNGGSIIITYIYECCKFSLQLESVSLKLESYCRSTADMTM